MKRRPNMHKYTDPMPTAVSSRWDHIITNKFRMHERWKQQLRKVVPRLFFVNERRSTYGEIQ